MSNPASIATPVKDIQGDGRWQSQVRSNTYHVHNELPF